MSDNTNKKVFHSFSDLRNWAFINGEFVSEYQGYAGQSNATYNATGSGEPSIQDKIDKLKSRIGTTKT